MNKFFDLLRLSNSHMIYSLALTGMILISILYYSLHYFHVCEKRDDLLFNLPTNGQQLGTQSTPIEVGFVVENFEKFNVKEDIFEVKGNIWFKFNHNHIPLEKLNNFSFDNGKIIQISTPKIKLINNQQLFVYYDVSILFNSLLNHRLFPFTDHSIYLMLRLDQFSSHEIKFISGKNNLKIYKNTSSEGWKLVDYKIEAGYITRYLNQFNSQEAINYPRAIFTFSFEKPGSRKAFLIFGPMMMIFFLALIALITPSHHSNIALNIAIGSLSALLLHRLLIESLSPLVGYFTLTDYLYLYFLGTIFIILLLCTQDSNSASIIKIKQFLYYFFQIVSIALLIGLQMVLSC